MVAFDYAGAWYDVVAFKAAIARGDRQSLEERRDAQKHRTRRTKVVALKGDG